MKLVFTRDEIAAALSTTPEEFDRLRPSLEATGFPHPVPLLEPCWPIMEVISWVNHSGPSMAAALRAAKEGKPPQTDDTNPLGFR